MDQEKKTKDSYGASLAEVYGDIVRIRDLAIATLLGILGGPPVFALAKHLLVSWVAIEPEKAKGYALFLGMLGCLAAGVASARWFKAKRDLVTEGRVHFEEAILSLGVSLKEERAAVEASSEDNQRELREVGVSLGPRQD
jgi:hypothetical protein